MIKNLKMKKTYVEKEGVREEKGNDEEEITQDSYIQAFDVSAYTHIDIYQ